MTKNALESILRKFYITKQLYFSIKHFII